MNDPKIIYIRVVYDDGGTIEAAPEAFSIIPDRLALARALVADMPGVVVAKVPAKASQWDSPGYDHWTPPNIIWADGYNAAISDMFTAGSTTDAK